MNKELLRRLPQIDEVLRLTALRSAADRWGHDLTAAHVRAAIDDLRRDILAGGEPDVSPDAVAQSCVHALERGQRPSLRRVVNATGVVLHTNLGRAPLCDEAAQAAADVACRYNTLEYDAAAGRRGSRYSHVDALLCSLLGCESAMVVNNNAAAVLLVLSTLVRGREAVVSRGELVEIGGSFRVPEIMEMSGGLLREVGTTNKTHPQDYVSAIGEQTAAILKVHTSNYRILGFTEEVPAAELAGLAHEHGLPMLYDLGSGALCDPQRTGLGDEPTVAQAMASGADVVCFSGDKLLGGPQAGIIVGKKQYIDQMKKNPLTRALRIDKMTLAALEATLRVYQDSEKPYLRIPILEMLSLPEEALRGRAEALCARLKDGGVSCQCVPESGQVGGGSVPTRLLPTWCVAIDDARISAAALDERLRGRDVPVVGRIAHDRLLLDMRTLLPGDSDELAAAVTEVFGK